MVGNILNIFYQNYKTQLELVHIVLFDLGLSGTMGSIMITMKSTLGLSGTSLVGLLRKGAQKIPGFMLVNLIPNT